MILITVIATQEMILVKKIRRKGKLLMCKKQLKTIECKERIQEKIHLKIHVIELRIT